MSARIRFGVVEHRPTLDRQLRAVQTALVAVEHEELRRLEPHQLTAQLAADRAAGAGDEHPPAGDVLRDRDRIDVGRMPAEQVGLVDRPDVGDAHPAEHLVDRRQHEHLESGVVGHAR